MITFALHCREPDCNYAFDSDFKSGDAYERLAAARLLTCARCGSAEVAKSLMAPAVIKAGRKAGTVEARDRLNALRDLRRKVEAEGEDVGSSFADEARAIHLGKSPERLVYGSATPQETRELIDDGVPVTPLPWVPLLDA